MSDTDLPLDLDWTTVRGADLAQQDPHIGVDFAGRWVVAWPDDQDPTLLVVAGYGDSPDEARVMAERKYGRLARTLMACSICHPSQWMTNA